MEEDNIEEIEVEDEKPKKVKIHGDPICEVSEW